jgi:NhaA family Na+:H+ antiporter
MNSNIKEYSKISFSRNYNLKISSKSGRKMILTSKSFVDRILVTSFKRFLDTQNHGSRLLLLSTIIALVWANSSYWHSYEALWNTEIGLKIGHLVLSNSLSYWINDGLMAIFFFVIGLEIKREILVGEISNPRKAALPVIAAFGGMMVPAIIYTIFNFGTSASHGWGIPMATDIAFALGCLMILINRIPAALKVFLLAVAIVDDIGAIIVIALFYTSDLQITALLIGLIILAILLLLNYLGVQRVAPYGILGILLWLAFLESGVHATIAGVLLAFTIPSQAQLGTKDFIRQTEYLLEQFPDRDFNRMCIDKEQRKQLKEFKNVVKNIGTPLQRLEDTLHPFSTFFIIPLFALANAGVRFVGEGAGIDLTNSVTLGVVIGLVVGKQIGVILFSWLAVKLGIAHLPEGVEWPAVYGLSCLAGIGFTMSFFITNLAFKEALMMHQAKTGILTASLISAIIGLIVLWQYTAKSNSMQK